MKSLLFGISPLDPITYLTVPLVLAAAAAIASYLPARRAAAINPVEALRVEYEFVVHSFCQSTKSRVPMAQSTVN